MIVKINAPSSLDISPFMRSYIETCADNFAEFLQEDEQVSCSVKLSNRQIKIKFLIVSPIYTVRAECREDDFYEAVYKASDKAKRCLIRKKEKHIDSKRKRCFKEHPKRQKVILDEVMTYEEAVERMDALNYDFFMFIDEETGTPASVYAREDGGYGLIQMESIG